MIDTSYRFHYLNHTIDCIHDFILKMYEFHLRLRKTGEVFEYQKNDYDL